MISLHWHKVLDSKKQTSQKSWAFNPFRPAPGQREKVNLNFYFYTSSWCLKRFYEGLKGLHKTFSGTTKKCENENWTLQLSEMDESLRVNILLEDSLMIEQLKAGICLIESKLINK